MKLKLRCLLPFAAPRKLATSGFELGESPRPALGLGLVLIRARCAMKFGLRLRGGLLATLILFGAPVVAPVGAILVSSSALAQTVQSISVEGNRRVEVETIRSYFKPGPGTPHDAVAYRILKPENERSKTAVDHFGKAYVNGNIVEGYERVVLK